MDWFKPEFTIYDIRLTRHRAGQIVNRKSTIVNPMSRDYWEHRYQTGDTRWEKGAPSPGLVDFLAANPDLKRGTVCVPGCGSGHDVREFARAGFDAFGFDFAPSAIASAEEKTKA